MKVVPRIAGIITAWLGLITLLSPSFRVWGITILPVSASFTLLGLGATGIVLTRRQGSQLPIRTVCALIAVVWCVLVFMPLSANVYSFQGLVPAWGTALAILAAWLVVRARSNRVPELSLLLVQCLAAYLFIRYADGRLFFSDDHPSFMYRLHLLKEHFPNIPFYNPEWNAGYQAREFFPSGVLNLFLLAYPLISLIDFTQTQALVGYNLLILIMYVGVIPWASYLSVRLLGGDRLWAIIAAAAALFPSVAWSDWLFRYGTLGFCLSSGLFPLAWALLARVYLEDRSPAWHLVAATIFVATLCMLWSLTLIALLPLGLIVLWRIIRRPSARTIAATLVLLAVNLPWAIVFVRESKVLTFLQGSSRPASVFTAAAAAPVIPEASGTALSTRIEEASRGLREAFLKMNPVILLVGCLGFLGMQSRQLRTALLGTALWLFSLAALGDVFKPQLELHRMFLFLLFLSTTGLGLFLSQVDTPSKRWITGMCTGIAALTLLSPIALAHVLSGKSREHLSLSPRYLTALADSIKAHGGDGRVFFPGFILHELGARAFDTQDGGHVALLPMLADKPMYAFNFYHTSWSIVDPIPRAFRKRDRAGVNEFLDLMNVTAVVTFKREWARFFSNRPAYQFVSQHGRFRVFKRIKGNFGYVLRGQAEVRPLKDGIELVAASEEVVIKFRYHPKLKVTGAELFSEHVFDDDLPGGQSTPVHFIGVRVPKDQLGKPLRISM